MENASTVQFQKIYFGAFAVKRQIQITQFYQLGMKFTACLAIWLSFWYDKLADWHLILI